MRIIKTSKYAHNIFSLYFLIEKYVRNIGKISVPKLDKKTFIKIESPDK